MVHNTKIENEPREEIDADLAVEMVNSGFHVFIDKSDEQITYDMAFGHHPERFDFENHTFTAPMMEVAQYNATVALCEKFDSLNNDVRADIGRSLEDYADELFDNDESEFMWNNGLSEWENINTSILSGETEYLRNFLNDVSVHYSSRTADLLEDLNDYTAAYLNRNKAEHIPQQDNTYAYKTGGSAPFTIVYLDIGTQERKTAVTDALNNIINNVYGERTHYGEINPLSQPYRNLLDHVQNGETFLVAFEGHLDCLKYALANTDTSKELCAEMLESISSAEKNPSPEIVIKGFSCRFVDKWEERGTSYSIGQDGAFYHAAVSDGMTFEYDFKPDREKIMSDHADKMAEVYMDHYEAEHGADGYAMFPDTEARTENIRRMQNIEEKMQLKEQVEHIPQQQDISHNNADPSAQRGERQNIMADKKERSTKLAVTSMTIVDSETSPNLKALATVALNDEFVIKGIKVVAGEKGLFASMPSRCSKGEYSDIIFPITKQAYQQLNETVIDSFSDLVKSGEQSLYNPVDTPEKSVSKISVSLHRVDKENLKAAGQIVIDDNFVITGVMVVEGNKKDDNDHILKDENGNNIRENYVQMPYYQSRIGEYPKYANAITTEMHDKIKDKVLTAYELLPAYRGVKLAELGDKENTEKYKDQNNKFAKDFMDVLDAAGIDYNAEIIDHTTITIKAADKERADKLKRDLVTQLKKENEKKKSEKGTSITEQLSQAKKIAEQHNERKSGEVKKHKEQEL